MKNTVGIILLILLFLLPPVTDAKTYYKITFKGSKAPKEATFYKEGDRYCTKSYGGENCISENMVGSVEEIEGEWIKPTINDSKHKNTQVTVSKKSNIAKLKSRIYKEH